MTFKPLTKKDIHVDGGLDTFRKENVLSAVKGLQQILNEGAVHLEGQARTDFTNDAIDYWFSGVLK